MDVKCTVTPDERISFAIGEAAALEAHVADCPVCQDFLAELWADELERDLTEPVMQAVRIEQFLMDAARTGGALVARFAEALLVYLSGRSDG